MFALAIELEKIGLLYFLSTNFSEGGQSTRIMEIFVLDNDRSAYRKWKTPGGLWSVAFSEVSSRHKTHKAQTRNDKSGGYGPRTGIT